MTTSQQFLVVDLIALGISIQSTRDLVRVQFVLAVRLQYFV